MYQEAASASVAPAPVGVVTFKAKPKEHQVDIQGVNTERNIEV
jgi:hypothetical protein